MDQGAGSGTPHRLAVLGDSDSHSYRDDVSGVRRGGEYHGVTYQWTEIIDATRGAWLDQGGNGERGSRGIVARLRATLGLEAKTPRKADFRWNYARSGARCASLGSEWPQQTRWLISALRADLDAWRDGVVIIRIGINDLGQERHLDAWAQQGLDDAAREAVARCVREIDAAVRAIRQASADVRIVVVGIADDSSWPYGVVPPRTPAEIANARAVLDHFDARLRAIVERTPRAAFMDDRRWYYDNWPDRDADGNAQLGGVSLGGATYVTNTQGDHPSNLALADGHAGTVANGFWARELIRTLNDAFGWDVPPLTDAEIAALADPDGSFGIAAAHDDAGARAANASAP